MSISMQSHRCVIFANGLPPSGDEINDWLRPNDVLICADGGARIALQYKLQPAAVIGDFDSLSVTEIAILAKQNIPLIRFPSAKNETDLELALLLAASAPLPSYASNPITPPVLPHCNEIIILGALGGRTDQTLANMMLMLLPALADIRVILANRHEQISRVTPSNPVEIIGRRGDTVSLLPLGGDVHGIITDGLEYPLHHETLTFGPARGISNVMLTERAHIHIAQGQLICILSASEKL